MRRLKLTLEYDGTGFYGWQVQTRTGERTVQGILHGALAKLPGSHSTIKAAGRTDAGVHALAMVAHLDTDTSLADIDLARALNAHLPPDVRILNITAVDSDFDAQYDCCYRRYLYRLRLAREDASGLALERFRVLHLFRNVDVMTMQRVARHFEGTRDFSALATQETRSRERTVHLCKFEAEGPNLTLHIAANGFLRGMVRAVVGTLLEVGTGKLAPGEVVEILDSKDRARAGKNVPPHGLYFAEAGYEPWGGVRMGAWEHGR